MLGPYHMTAEQGVRRLDDLLRSFCATLRGDAGQTFGVSFSAGVAVLRREVDDLAQPLRRAGATLCRAKRQGRARTLATDGSLP